MHHSVILVKRIDQVYLNDYLKKYYAFVTDFFMLNKYLVKRMKIKFKNAIVWAVDSKRKQMNEFSTIVLTKHGYIADVSRING